MIAPAPLVPGDIVQVIAPSGPFDSDLALRGIARLAGFDVRLAPDSLHRREGFFAGSDSERLTELQAALDSTEAKAILIARGGYGISRIASGISWDGMRAHPKWLVGFSDATVLHLLLQRFGLASLHAPNATTLATAKEGDVEALRRCLTQTQDCSFSALLCWATGKAEGPLMGGNLTVLFTEATSGRLQLPKGCVLFLEDVSETSYRIDRMLSALIDGGHFADVAGIVLGDFHECSPGKWNVPTTEVLRSGLARLKVPLVAGLPCGHGENNHPLLLGGWARLDATEGTLFISAPRAVKDQGAHRRAPSA